MSIMGDAEHVVEFAPLNVLAFTTTRRSGTFGLLSSEPTRDVTARWAALRQELRVHCPRLATAGQVHGTHVVVHTPGWDGWLRVDQADGHLSMERRTAMAVTIADCVPIFVAHPSGPCAVLHSGWRGTATGILGRGIAELSRRGIDPAELAVHFGPAICGACYEVGPEVYTQLTGREAHCPTYVDLRELLTDQARTAGVRHVSSSRSCTRCDNARFFSHRAGDEGRQLGVIVAQ
jgi:polyphenol oxidase